MKKIILSAATILLLAACGGDYDHLPTINAQPPVQHLARVTLEEAASRQLTCNEGPDCDQKWQRALQWVVKNGTYSVTTKTDSMIKTAGPLEPTTDSAFTITKSPTNNGTDLIQFSSSCGHEIKRTCDPTALELKKRFINYVLFGD